MLGRQCNKLRSSVKVISCSKIAYSNKVNLQKSCFLLGSSKRFLGNQNPISKSDIFVSAGPTNKNVVGGNKRSRISSVEFLEKLIAGISTDIHQKNRVYKNDFIRVIDKIKETNMSSRKQGLLLIKCCTELMPDEMPSTRMALVQELWNAIKPHTTFDVEHYNELLRVYIANNKKLVVSKFIGEMGAVKPNLTTFELILRTLGEAGDINQCTEVISNMKAQGLPATENVFNSLIICHGKSGNLDNIPEILTMMKSLQLDYSVNTYTAIARAYGWNKKNQQLIKEMNTAVKNGITFGEVHIMDIVKTLAFVGNHVSIPEVLKYLPRQILESPSITPTMQSVATLLVFQSHPMAALEIYKILPLPSFGPKDDMGLHGRSLVRDCVKASTPSSVIALISQELMSSGRNAIALQNAAEAALQLGKVPLALDLFTRMKQFGMPVRPHYFWPILLQTSKTYGEKGVMNTLSTMSEMEVKPDYETIMDYTLPYVSFTSPQNLMKKFQEAGLTVTSVLTPMMVTLLNTGQVRAASEICELFDGKVDAELVIKPLLKGFLISSDIKSVIHILEDITAKALDKKKDWVGRFLCALIKNKRVKEDFPDILSIVKALQGKGIKISTSAADYCLSRIPEHPKKELIDSFKEALVNITDERLVDEGEMFVQQIQHPKQMNEEALSAHLVELESKGMNTRGVLRKLLQQYCRSGNLAAAREILEKCEREGVFLSAGMKASIFDLHVKQGELDMAELVLADLNKSSPNFTLDEYKVIDFATLMVYRKKIDKAFELINEQSRKRHITGGRNLSMNCWRLMDAVAAQGSVTEARRMFTLLTSLRYCKPSNTLLGPLVRAHLKNGDLEQAVQEFVSLAEKYKKTPLKHELLCKVLLAMNEGKSEERFISNEQSNGKLNKLAQTILNVDRQVHGASDVQVTLIAALADVGYKMTLRKIFLDPTTKFHPDALLRHCERFADEKKIHALEAIADTSKDLRHVHIEEIYNLILDIYQREDNCKDALTLFYKMQENDIEPSKKFIENICSLFKSNNKLVPPDVALIRDKLTKGASKKAV
ncbi:leucine-rich PPR motif-containing protein, mitochondrial-like [Danaus plexippus]|uniref:leucine-rich PPR motif-containing protein, mitochondrial-like n=1 Tax=Danaus plexippus TaxID=13037 RepID=UPI002AB0CC23|nr:leucine-rich PPR motif-containing protein, mitochondrial-like [Danaus plexippus]